MCAAAGSRFSVTGTEFIPRPPGVPKAPCGRVIHEMTTDFYQLEFVGGPLDGAIRPVPFECIEVPLAAGAVIHIYRRDETYDGIRVKQIMRHFEAVPAWRDRDDSRGTGSKGV